MTASPMNALLAAGVYLTVLGPVLSEKALANGFDQRAEIGFAIAEQQGIALNHDDPAIGLGSYLVNSAGCNDCHTWPNYAPGGNPFTRQPKQVPVANFLAGGRLFKLPTEDVCSRNITPDPRTSKPAGLSRADFLHVMQTGCDPKDANFHDVQTCGLLQIMPWPNYQKMKPQELKAIYSFLSALPHAEPGGAAQCPPDPQGVAGE
jgi:hypothetical protein